MNAVGVALSMVLYPILKSETHQGYCPPMTTLFWILIITLAYSYIGYGVLLIALAPVKRLADPKPPSLSPRVAVLIAAHNEENDIGRKLNGLLNQKGFFGGLEIIVVSDGSTDGTPHAVKAYAGRGVRLLVTDGHVGKIAALNLAMSEIESEVVVFTDANSQLRPDALQMLLRHFTDPSVGCACGSIGVPAKGRGWIAKAESLYWHYDHALKRAESRLGRAADPAPGEGGVLGGDLDRAQAAVRGGRRQRARHGDGRDARRRKRPKMKYGKMITLRIITRQDIFDPKA